MSGCRFLRNCLVNFLGLFVAGCVSACSVPGSGKQTIRIGTWNVLDMFDELDDPLLDDGPPASSARLRLIAEVIRSVDCDILSLQEVENQAMLERFNTEYLNETYPFIAVSDGSDPRGIDVAVISRVPLSGVEYFDSVYITEGGESSEVYFSRKLLAVHWLDTRGREWTLLSVHLKSGGTPQDAAQRRRQVLGVSEICRRQGYVDGFGRGILILAGDINAEPGSEELRILRAVPLSDPGRDLPYRRTHRSGKVLDYVLLSPDADARYEPGSLKVFLDSETGNASDHFPVFLDMVFP